MNESQIVNRCDRVMSDRKTVDDMWDAIELYIAPYRGRFFKDERSENSIQWRKPFVYDGTAIMASQNLASSLHSRLTSASIRWFGMKFKAQELSDNKAAMEWLEACSDEIYDAMQTSNFNVEVNEVYQDLVNFGDGFLMSETDDDKATPSPVNFNSVPIKEGFFEQDSRGRISTFYWVLQWTPVQIYDKFGEEGTPKEIIKEALNPATDTQKKYDIIWCIYRRQKIEIDPMASNLDELKRPFGSKFVLRDSAKLLGEEGGYYEMPVFAPRWRTTSSSKHGNSPAMIALSDTLTLNRTIELNLTAVEKMIDPPILTTSRGLIGDLDLTAGGLSVVRDVSEVAPFQSGARFDVTYQEMNRLRENINAYFFIPQLILPPMEGTPATATEISVRMQQLEALIGPTLGRLQVDLLQPTIMRTFGILYRSGKIPEAPQVVLDSGGAFEIEYTSPIAKTQEASSVAAIERWLMGIMGMAEANPDVLDIPDWDKIVKQLASMQGVSQALIKAKEEIEASRAQRQEIQAQMQQGAAMKEMGEGMQAVQQAGAPA